MITQEKEVEIVLKINLDTVKRFEKISNEVAKEWTEPRLDYSISEKIKESKSTSRGNLGFDYQIQINKNTNEIYVEKIEK